MMILISYLLSLRLRGSSLAVFNSASFLDCPDKGMARPDRKCSHIIERRGAGLGHEMISWAIDTCRERGCRIIQLTSDKTRHDAADLFIVRSVLLHPMRGLSNQYEKLYISAGLQRRVVIDVITAN